MGSSVSSYRTAPQAQPPESVVIGYSTFLGGRAKNRGSTQISHALNERKATRVGEWCLRCTRRAGDQARPDHLPNGGCRRRADTSAKGGAGRLPYSRDLLDDQLPDRLHIRN